MERVFILKKDIASPVYTIKEGSIFKQYYKNESLYIWEDYKLNKDYVENNPIWFKEIINYEGIELRPNETDNNTFAQMGSDFTTKEVNNIRRYNYSFAELVDRINIVQMKQIFTKEGKEKFQEEITDILHDIQLFLDEGVVITADIIRAIVVLTQSNLEIWKNEDGVRELNDNREVEEIAKTLLYTHSLNSTRSGAKTRIQYLIGGRTDPKINYIGSAWDIKW